MGDALDLSLWSFNNLNRYNSTEVSLLNAQTRMGDIYIETLEGGQVVKNWEGGKGEDLRWVTDTALWLKAHSSKHGVSSLWDSAWRGKKSDMLVLLSAWGSKDIQWTFLHGWAVLATPEPSDLGRDKAQKCSHNYLAIGIPERETKQQNQAMFSLTELASLHPPCWGVEHTISKSTRTGTTKTLFFF